MSGGGRRADTRKFSRVASFLSGSPAVALGMKHRPCLLGGAFRILRFWFRVESKEEAGSSSQGIRAHASRGWDTPGPGVSRGGLLLPREVPSVTPA